VFKEYFSWKEAQRGIFFWRKIMTVFKGMGFYHVEAMNTNRIVDIQVVAPAGQSNVFLFLKGDNAFHPFIGRIAAPTVNQKIAQYRVDYVVRYLSIYAIPVGVWITDVNLGGSETNNALKIQYETYVSNVFPVTSGTLDEPITDLYGLADRAAKTKVGLQGLADLCVANASLDGGQTLLYAVNPKLSDGTASTAAVVGVAPGTFTVTTLTPSMY
jgi:hypothetical protein